MNDHKAPPPPADFDQRLKAAQAKRDTRRDRLAMRKEKDSGWGFGFRIGVEIVSALGVGTLIGWLLDGWIGTRPWMMLLGFLLGAAAGILNVYRLMAGLGYGSGYHPDPKAAERDEDRTGHGGNES